MFDSRTVKQIKLRYRDASTPPRHHRSYTIVATREELHVSIDVYGIIVAEERNLVSQADWQTLSRAVTELEWISETASDGNTGGSAYSLELTAGDEHCSCTWSRERTPGSERLTVFAKRLERLVPSLAALIETPYPG